MNENERTSRQSRNSDVTLGSILRLLLNKCYLLLIGGLAVAAAVFLILTFVVSPTYKSRVSFYVYNSSDKTVQSGTINNGDLQAAESLATTYSKVLESNSVLDAVLKNLGSNSKLSRKDLSEMTKVSVISDTQLLEVVVTSSDKEFACKVANSFAKVAPAQIVRITKAGGVEVVDKPEVATEKSSPRTGFDTVVGFIVGVLVVAVILLIKFLSDTTIYLPEDIKKLSNATVLGQIPEIVVSADDVNLWNVEKGAVVRLEERKH